MPGPKPLRVQEVIDAIKSGALTEAQLNDSVRRILEDHLPRRPNTEGW